MGEFLHKYNTDNVHSRAVIVGLVNLLNGKVMFENILSDTSIDIVYVPFFYNQGGDERFMQDYFLQWNDCINPKHADGNYDVIPRGVVTMSSKSIDTGKLTHRFVRGTYVKEVNGQLQQFNAFINSLPITMQFSVEIETDTNLDAFKIEQAIMETFYKTQVFSVNFRGFRVPCQVGFSDDYGVERTFDYTYQANARTKVTFDLELETYYPVTDHTSERSNSNRMNLGGNAGSLQESWPETYADPRFNFLTPVTREKYFSGGVLPITWTNTGPILRVNLYYRVIGSESWIPIAMNLTNNGYYNWEIPFLSMTGDEVPNESQRAYAVSAAGKGAKLRPIVNDTGGVDSIVILASGFVYTNTDHIRVELFPKPFVLPEGYTEPEISLSVKNSGEIYETSVLSAGSGYYPSPLNEIEFKIQDANSESIYLVLDQELVFTADVDNTVDDGLIITNLNPSVSELMAQGLTTGLGLFGAGIVNGTLITSIDIITNTLGINKSVNMQVSNGTLNTSITTGKIYLQ